MELSTHKTKLCIFSRSRKRFQIDVNVNNVLLEVVDSIRYLGMWLDRKLRWTKHINEVYEKTVKFLSVCCSGCIIALHKQSGSSNREMHIS
jgi:hypothetical protein